MSLSSFTIPSFTGLDLIDDSQELGVTGASDLLNVDLDRRGRLRTRDGFAAYSTSGGTATYQSMVPTPNYLALFRNSGTNILLDVMFGGSTTIANIGTWAGFSAPTLTSTTSLGTPTSNLFFMASAATSGNVALRRYDGAATISTGAGGSPRYVAVTPWDNRLVAAYYTTAGAEPTGSGAGSASTVSFSDPGDPLTFSTNNYIHLHPGDGEVITAMATWRELLFVFKQTRLFIFYGTSTSGTGTPIFNYRTVNIPEVRTSVWYPSVASGTDGVYLTASNGIYRTQGGVPELISHILTPIFRGTATSSVNMASSSSVTLSWANERLYLIYTTQDATTRTLVYDAITGNWLIWSFTGGQPVEWRSATDYLSPVDTYTFGSNAVYKLTTGQTTDNGTDIPASYQSGFYELSPGNKAKTRWTHLWGSGSPTFDIYTDHATSDPLTRGGAVTLGTAPAIAKGIHNKAYKGDLFSHRLSSTSGAWSVNRIQHDIAETSKP